MADDTKATSTPVRRRFVGRKAPDALAPTTESIPVEDTSSLVVKKSTFVCFFFFFFFFFVNSHYMRHTNFRDRGQGNQVCEPDPTRYSERRRAQ